MIDIHTHIISDIDDGSNSIEETFEILKEASNNGFTDVILTPHYIKDYYDTNTNVREYWVSSIQKVLDQLELPIKVYVGNEIYVCENMGELILNNMVSTLNNSKYVLFELPMNNNITYLEEIIFQLFNIDKIPIIAHPERYSYFQNNIEEMKKLHQKGVLFQSNYGSILGLYGDGAKKTVTKLLKENLVDFLGSDVHKSQTVYAIIKDSKKKIKSIVGKERLEELTTLNAKKILLNE